MGIEVVIRDHSCAMLMAFSNKACLRLAIEAKILALLEGLLQARPLHFDFRGSFVIIFILFLSETNVFYLFLFFDRFDKKQNIYRQ